MAKKRANGDGLIRQRSDGRWEGRISLGFDPGTGKLRQKSIYGKSQQEVRKKMTQLAGEVDEGLYVEPSKLTVGQWLDIWLREYTGDLKPLTIKAYKKDVERHIKPGLGKLKLTAVTPPAIQAFYNAKQKGEGALSAKSVKNLHGTVHRALQQAVRIGYLKLNPASACTLPKTQKKEMLILEGDQISAFLEAIKGHPLERALLIYLYTGLRQSELIGLSWPDVDLETGKLYTHRQLQKQPEGYKFETLKNNRTRTITLAPSAVQVLKEQRRMQREWQLQAGPAWENDEQLCFTDEVGHHLYADTIYGGFKRIVAKIELPDLRPHDLRHSFATLQLQAGVPPKVIQQSLGHHSVSFTLDTYAHVTQEMQQEAAAKLEAIIQEHNKK